MPAFRRVEDARAGSTAIGILVPPGQRTFVILRPRALNWDLLPALANQSFCNFDRDQAAGLARQVQRELEAATQLEAGVRPTAGGFHAWVGVSGFTWVVCPRVPGAAYKPVVFAQRETAQEAIQRLLPFLHPAEGVEQEYYFNTQNFAR